MFIVACHSTFVWKALKSVSSICTPIISVLISSLYFVCLFEISLVLDVMNDCLWKLRHWGESRTAASSLMGGDSFPHVSLSVSHHEAETPLAQGAEVVVPTACQASLDLSGWPSDSSLHGHCP